jgi:hypothetical protein
MSGGLSIMFRLSRWVMSGSGIISGLLPASICVLERSALVHRGGGRRRLMMVIARPWTGRRWVIGRRKPWIIRCSRISGMAVRVGKRVWWVIRRSRMTYAG